MIAKKIKNKEKRPEVTYIMNHVSFSDELPVLPYFMPYFQSCPQDLAAQTVSVSEAVP